MKKKKKCDRLIRSKKVRALAVSLLVILLLFACAKEEVETDLDIDKMTEHIHTLPAIVQARANAHGIHFSVNGEEAYGIPYAAYMNEHEDVMLSSGAIGAIFPCTVFETGEGITLSRSGTEVFLGPDGEEAYTETKDGRLYYDARDIVSLFGGRCEWDVDENRLSIRNLPEEEALPASYDYRNTGRQSSIKDQGELETCWALAATTAMETCLLPSVQDDFSPDHLIYHNMFGMGVEEGGSYTMSLAYALGWGGPVSGAEDPYGDGYSPDGLSVVRHVQEIRFPVPGDIEAIKRAVYLYGGVESSIYLDNVNEYAPSVYYNDETYGYCYQGSNEVDHDIVIIGWDDNFPASSFPGNVEKDGAFICQNSWGTEFGDNGVFYVSYCDSNIGSESVVYSCIESPDNYGKIYQSDLCGFIGTIGYEQEKAWFANVFTAEEDEEIEAVGFYTTGEDTSYKVYAVPEFSTKKDLKERLLLGEGFIPESGFYTVSVTNPPAVEAGSRFAIVVEIETPGSGQPVAIEYPVEGMETIDLSDGEGYISYDGKHWESTEKDQECNVCLKAYTSVTAN